jgi:CHAT domain-containing protein
VLENGRARRLRERRGAEPRGGEGEGAAGRAAPDAAAATTAARRHLARLSRELPADLGVVTWALLDDRLAVWAWTSDGAWSASEPVGRGRLTELVAATRQAILYGEPDAPREGLAALYDHLLAPVAEHLEGRSSLLLVPEGPLFEVPFAALVTPSGRYLVEDFALSLAPGLLAVRFTDSPPPPRSLLVVADPAFDREAHPELSRLAGAAREGRRIAEVYAEAGAEVELLEGDAATARRFLAALGRFDVVHVAAHGVENGRDPFLSYLLMAGGAEGDGLLTGLEVLASGAGEDHAAPRLVVLAACDSAGSRVTASEGPLGLAWPFLARGSDAVVATLWSLDDAASERLFVRFHEQLQKGQEPEQALRRVQVEAIQLGRPLLDWAPSEVLVSR